MKKIIFILILFSFTNSYSQKNSETENPDIRIFRSINNNRSHFLDKFISITDKTVFPAAIVTPITMFAFARGNKNIYDENSSVLLGVSEVTSLGLTLGIKKIVKRKRPFVTLPKVYSSENNSPTDDYSFPSSHTSTVFSMATALTLRYNDSPLLIAGAYTYAMIVSYGRIYLGVHYPSDVLAGAVVGAGGAILIYSIRTEIIKAKSNLFNETYSDDKKVSVNGYVALGSLVGAGFINNFLLGSKIPVLRKTNVTTGFNSVALQINF
ncbi:MAG: phosphatase PAP2 family protein [Bacteroidetes bacterium]|nr:phosphatase PAP2 family protein [Bacteroidota bacterium]